MEEEVITRQEHTEFCRRIDAENARQNSRLEALEDTVHQINSLTVSVEKLAVNMNGVLQQLTEQNGRLKVLEGTAGENWKKVVGGIITGVVGAIMGVVMAKFGFVG